MQIISWKKINDHADDSSIKAIIIRIDSPGGGVVVSQEIYNAVLTPGTRARRRCHVPRVRRGLGGYYIAAAGDRIVANPGDADGQHWRQDGVRQRGEAARKDRREGMVVKAGEYKDIGSPYREMSSPRRNSCRRSLTMCTASSSRPWQKEEPPGSGRKGHCRRKGLYGRQALQLKLVDQLATSRTASSWRQRWQGSREAQDRQERKEGAVWSISRRKRHHGFRSCQQGARPQQNEPAV